jgi:hypothetical protein
MLGLDDEELGAHPLRERTVDRAREHDPSLLEHSASDVVGEGRDGRVRLLWVRLLRGVWLQLHGCTLARQGPFIALGCNS